MAVPTTYLLSNTVYIIKLKYGHFSNFIYLLKYYFIRYLVLGQFLSIFSRYCLSIPALYYYTNRVGLMLLSLDIVSVHSYHCCYMSLSPR